jgi:hypothetical protein
MYLAVEHSDLVRVIGIGLLLPMTGTVNAELLSLELRTAGAVVTWRVSAEESIGRPEMLVRAAPNLSFRTLVSFMGGPEIAQRIAIVVSPAPSESIDLQLALPDMGLSTGWQTLSTLSNGQTP